MIRLLGFLVGSAVSVGVILIFLGVPDFQSRESVGADKAIADSIPLPDKPVAVMPPALPAEQLAVHPVPVPKDEPASAIVLPAEEIKWYSFWNPFRSEIAANGFVGQLEDVTGFDFRVVKIKTGVYEVAFAYKDDNERRSKLSQIASATGLELPSS